MIQRLIQNIQLDKKETPEVLDFIWTMVPSFVFFLLYCVKF